MGKMQRNKGAAAERELAGILRAHGYDARRGGQMQSQREATEADVISSLNIAGVPVHVESKRQERLEMEKWSLQAEADAPVGALPVVCWRRNRQPWRISMPLEDFLRLIKGD